MDRIIVLRSRHLESNERQGTDNGYLYSKHGLGLQTVTHALNAMGIDHEIWEENDLLKVDLPRVSRPRIVIVPTMRTCWERTFQRLVDIAQAGWLVFATSDSFFFERKANGPSSRVEEERFKLLFQLPEASTVSSLHLVEGDITFNQTRFDWLTAECGDSMGFKGYVLVVLGESPFLSSHGDIKIADARKSSGTSVETAYTGKISPAFLIREYPNGGIFIYGCFWP